MEGCRGDEGPVEQEARQHEEHGDTSSGRGSGGGVGDGNPTLRATGHSTASAASPARRRIRRTTRGRSQPGGSAPGRWPAGRLVPAGRVGCQGGAFGRRGCRRSPARRLPGRCWREFVPAAGGHRRRAPARRRRRPAAGNISASWPEAEPGVAADDRHDDHAAGQLRKIAPRPERTRTFRRDGAASRQQPDLPSAGSLTLEVWRICSWLVQPTCAHPPGHHTGPVSGRARRDDLACPCPGQASVFHQVPGPGCSQRPAHPVASTRSQLAVPRVW
jgi:hypothetical protein